MFDVLIALGLKGEGYFTPPASQLERLRAQFPALRIGECQDSELAEAITEARALLTWQFPPSALERARRLRFVMYAADGLGPKRLYPALVNSPVQVTNSRGARSQAMAEHAIGMLLALSRRLHEARDAQRDARWCKDELITGRLPGELFGQSIVLLGAGEIGARIGRILAHGFGCSLRVLRARPGLGDAGLSAPVFGLSQRLAAFQGANAVIASLPPTEEARGLIDQAALSALAPGALVVNVGRGGTIDEDALVKALSAEHLGGAALDVFAEEPLPAASPLWTRKDVLITPHSAGVTPELWPRVFEIFSDNLARSEAGLPLRKVVDKALGY
jgi:phosphoglycerate dehydrogenase-like enzyme